MFVLFVCQHLLNVLLPLQLLLGDNKLKSEAEAERICCQCPRVRNLSLVGNRFESVDELKPFVSRKLLPLL